MEALEIVKTEILDGPLGEHFARIGRVSLRLGVTLAVFLSPSSFLLRVLLVVFVTALKVFHDF